MSSVQCQRRSVVDVLSDRRANSSKPGERTDDYRVALVIEGGGMRGTVSAGMAYEVVELGLRDSFDAVYGSSAGAISAAWFASSNPAGLDGWSDPRFAQTLIGRKNLLNRRPLVDVERLIEDVYVNDFVLPYESLLTSPIEFHPLATDYLTGESVDLAPMVTDEATARLALRASSALPLLAGPPVELAGRRYYDAGLAESVPYRQALHDGVTHALVLRSKRNTDVSGAQPTRFSHVLSRTAFRGWTPELRDAFLTRGERSLADDQRLAALDREEVPVVVSIRPADDSPYVSRLASESDLLREAFRVGQEAVRERLSPDRIAS